MKMLPGIIYRADEPYDLDRPEYDCLMPADYVQPENEIGDCWVCDELGNFHPGYDCCGVPVHHSRLADLVRRAY